MQIKDIQQQFKAIEGLIDILPELAADPKRKSVAEEIEARSNYLNQLLKAKRLKLKTIKTTLTIESKL